jgi:hypothetical protein
MIIWIQDPRDQTKVMISVGNYFVRNLPDSESVWIQNETGEGLQLSHAKLEAWFEKLWRQEF